MKHLACGQTTIPALAVALGLALSLSACGGSPGPGPTSGPGTTGGEASVLTIEQALKADAGSTIQVRGALVAPGGASSSQMVLASVLLESYPPQAGGATLALAGLDLDDLVGLTSTVDRADTAPVVWSDYWFTAGGVIREGTLQVQSLPRVVSAVVGDLRVRFSPVSEPVKSGDTVWWAFDITNEGSTADTIIFGSGQRAEVVLTQGGVEKYRWSAGKAFNQAIEEVTIQPGQTWSAVVNDTLSLAPGVYDVTANITATHVPQMSNSRLAGSLPLLATTLTVH